MLLSLLSVLFGYQLVAPGWVSLGPWEPVPADYSPAGMSDFPVYRLSDPAPARPNSELSGD